jgi:hypothetical protein
MNNLASTVKIQGDLAGAWGRVAMKHVLSSMASVVSTHAINKSSSGGRGQHNVDRGQVVLLRLVRSAQVSSAGAAFFCNYLVAIVD